MTDTAEMQKKVNETRARLEQSLTALNERIEPKEIMEKSMNYLTENGPDVARSGLDFVRENPLAVGVVAAGLTWLALGGGPSSRQISNRARHPFGSGNDQNFDAQAFDVYANDKYAGDYRPHHLSQSDAGSGSLSDRANEFGEAVKQQASSAMDKAGPAVASAASSAREFGHEAAESSREAFDAGMKYAQSAASSSMSFGNKQMQERPLVVGGVALLGGLALAMMLPRTRAEARVMGDQAHAAREAAVRKTQQAYSVAKRRAGEAVDVVKEQAGQAADALKDQASSVAKEMSQNSPGKLNSSAGVQVGATKTASSGSQVVTADADGSSGRGSRGHNSPASTQVTHNDPDKLRPATKADENKTRDQLNS